MRTVARSGESQRIAVLWTRLSGYLAQCMRTLVEEYGVDLLVWDNGASINAPFDDQNFSWIQRRYKTDGKRRDISWILEALEEVKPTALLVSSWHIPAYRKVCKWMEGRCVRILCMDNQWLGTVKQMLGTIASPWYVRPLYDGVFLPGDRQADFARRLGFAESEIFRGFYSCDSAAFLPALEKRKRTAPHRRKSFLFVGRLVEVKGVDLLVNAYRLYRERAKEPWQLLIAGEGHLRHLVANVDGIELRGFVQPRDLPTLFGEASCLILPSTYE